jgi:hypothetical protein
MPPAPKGLQDSYGSHWRVSSAGRHLPSGQGQRLSVGLLESLEAFGARAGLASVGLPFATAGYRRRLGREKSRRAQRQPIGDNRAHGAAKVDWARERHGSDGVDRHSS